MPKIQITEELATTIRKIRTDNKIKANDVAKYIKKSPAYITKLEKAELKSIDEDTLMDLFAYITFGTQSHNDLDLLNNIYQKLRVFYTPKELEEQVWFYNFESMRCKLPVPAELVDEFNAKIEALNISRDYLLSRINSNESISENVTKLCSATPNQWILIDSALEEKQLAILIDFPEETFNNILDKEKDSCSYTFIFCIAYYLFKIQEYGETIKISDEDHMILYKNATTFLNKYHFYTPSTRDALMAKAKSIDEAEQYFTTYDSESKRLISSILGAFTFISDVNIKKANAQLGAFENNLRWDIGFIMTLISLDFASLNDLSYSKKKELLDLIKNKIQEYKSIPKEENIEEY